MLGRLAVQLLILGAVYLVVIFLYDRFFNGWIAALITRTFGSGLYDFFYWMKDALFVGGYFVLALALCLRLVLRYVGYADQVNGALQTLLRDELPLPELPPELSDVDATLHTIRRTISRNEQNAREAEQRKNDLVVYLAHDLKTPLTSVIGYLTLLTEAPDLPPEQRAKYIGITLDKALRLEQLINEFFDITRFNLQSIHLDNNRIDLTLMLEQMVDEFYPILAERRLTAVLRAAPDLQLLGDADKLARVFDNLLRNAVGYSYPDTVITVSAERVGDRVVVAFRNVGDEIPAHRLDNIFEKFFRLDSARGTKAGGAGLGLAIARQIVELHGGVISAASSPEATTFTVTLPIRLQTTLQPPGRTNRSN